MVNLDRTFCSGVRCGRHKACARWVGHLARMEPDRPSPALDGKSLSIAQYDDGTGYCEVDEPWVDPKETR